MRLLGTVGFAFAACASCFPYDASSEFVPVTVRVYNGEAEAVAARARPSVADPCDATPPDVATCTPVATVRVRDLERDPNCYYDTKVTNGEVGRVMQCGARSIVVFETATFVGAPSTPSGFVDACTSSTYDFPQGDECTWRTEQRIVGSLDGPLTFSYAESPIAWSAASGRDGAWSAAARREGAVSVGGDGAGRACTLACRQHAALDVVRQ